MKKLEEKGFNNSVKMRNADGSYDVIGLANQNEPFLKNSTTIKEIVEYFEKDSKGDIEQVEKLLFNFASTIYSAMKLSIRSKNEEELRDAHGKWVQKAIDEIGWDDPENEVEDYDLKPEILLELLKPKAFAEWKLKNPEPSIVRIAN